MCVPYLDLCSGEVVISYGTQEGGPAYFSRAAGSRGTPFCAWQATSKVLIKIGLML